MTLDALRYELRVRRLDDAVAPFLWSDAELDDYLNDAVRQACIRQRLIVDAETPEVCALMLAPNQRSYAVHPAVLAVRAAAIEGNGALTITTLRRLARRDPDWFLDEDACGSPEFLIVDYQQGKIALHPTPDAAATLRLCVWRTPLDEIERMQAPDDEPVAVPAGLHADLVDWAQARAYDKKDAETLDVSRGLAAEARFTATFGRLPDATEIRLWGVAPLGGVPAAFL